MAIIYGVCFASIFVSNISTCLWVNAFSFGNSVNAYLLTSSRNICTFVGNVSTGAVSACSGKIVSFLTSSMNFSRIRVFAALRQMAHELLCLGIFPVGVRDYALDAIDNLVQCILACHKRAVDCSDFLLHLLAFFIKRAVKSDFADKILHNCSSYSFFSISFIFFKIIVTRFLVTLYFLQSVECPVAFQFPAILNYLATALPTLTMYASSASLFLVHLTTSRQQLYTSYMSDIPPNNLHVGLNVCLLVRT